MIKKAKFASKYVFRERGVTKPKLKGKSCNNVSLATYDDSVTVASLSDSEVRSLP